LVKKKFRHGWLSLVCFVLGDAGGIHTTANLIHLKFLKYGLGTFQILKLLPVYFFGRLGSANHSHAMAGASQRGFGWRWQTLANASSPRRVVTYPFDLLVKLKFRHGWLSLVCFVLERDFGWLRRCWR